MIVALAAQTAHRTLALCHHWRNAGGRSLMSSGLKGVAGTSITTELFDARGGFSVHCRIDDPRWWEAVIRTGSDAARKIGPAEAMSRRWATRLPSPKSGRSGFTETSIFARGTQI